MLRGVLSNGLSKPTTRSIPEFSSLGGPYLQQLKDSARHRDRSFDADAVYRPTFSTRYTRAPNWSEEFTGVVVTGKNSGRRVMDDAGVLRKFGRIEPSEKDLLNQQRNLVTLDECVSSRERSEWEPYRVWNYPAFADDVPLGRTSREGTPEPSGDLLVTGYQTPNGRLIPDDDQLKNGNLHSGVNSPPRDLLPPLNQNSAKKRAAFLPPADEDPSLSKIGAPSLPPAYTDLPSTPRESSPSTVDLSSPHKHASREGSLASNGESPCSRSVMFNTILKRRSRQKVLEPGDTVCRDIDEALREIFASGTGAGLARYRGYRESGSGDVERDTDGDA